MKISDSPRYEPKTNSLYFNDGIGQYRLLRYDLTEKKMYKAKIPGMVGRLGFCLPIEGHPNKYLTGYEHDLVIVKWDGKSETAEIQCKQLRVVNDVSGDYVHDGRADSHGRLYVGSIRDDMCNPNSTAPPGSLFRSDNGKDVHKLVPDLTIANDIVIDEKRNILYVVETCSTTIRAFDWNPHTGAVCKYSEIIEIY